MPVRVKFSTKGFDEWLERVAQAGKSVDQVTDRALDAGGEVRLVGMRQRVPKDTHNLENNLSVDGPKADGNYHYIEVGLNRDVDADTARYGTVQEYGAVDTPAQPYIRPTLDTDLGKARAAMRQVFKEELGLE